MHADNTKTDLRNTLPYVQLIVFGGAILYVGKSLFIPLCFALLISFVLYPICRWLEGKGIGRMGAIVLALCLLVIAGSMLGALLASQVLAFMNEWPTLHSKFQSTTSEVYELVTNVFGMTAAQQQELISKFSDQSGGNIIAILQDLLAASAFSGLLLMLVPVYAVLILYHRRYWMKILGKIFPAESSKSLHEIISQSINAYYNFVKGMAIVYVIVGVLNSIGLLLLGIPHAILFGFTAAILTIVPYIGIIVGSLLPMAMAWLTYDSLWYPVGIAGIFAFVQYLEANVIFPVAVSNRLNVNTLVMLLVIFTGGILWGVSGMILFVPFVGIAKLIADHNPNWKVLSLILGTENRSKETK